MLHRRPGASSTGPTGGLTYAQGSSSSGGGHTAPGTAGPTINTAYTPLRRPSTGLYGTPPGANGVGLKARYKMPSPSPSFSGPSGGLGGATSPGVAPNGYGLYTGGGGGAGAASAAYDLSGSGGFGSGSSRDDMVATVVNGAKRAAENFRRGLEDALRLDRAFSLVLGDAELRVLVLKSTMINFLALVLLSFAQIVFSPLVYGAPSHGASPDQQHRTQEIGLWYNLLLSWPVLVTCFIINGSWGPSISRRAQTLLHPSYRHQPSPAATPVGLPTTPLTPTNLSQSSVQTINKVVSSLTRVIFIADFTIFSRLLGLLPLGRILATLYMAIVNSYYCFEWLFSSRGWTLDHRVTYVNERTAYMLGFGLPITLLSSFGSVAIIKTALFALIYPFFVVQALLSRPPQPSHSLLPATPSPHASLPPSPGPGSEGGGLNLSNPFFHPQETLARPGGWKHYVSGVPLFVMARYALQGLEWLEAALLRDRGEARRAGLKERMGKRAY